MRPSLLILLLLLPLASCRTLGIGGSSSRILETATGAELSPDMLADALADYDVVFLGELHDSRPAHRLQLRTTELLLERRGALTVSLEMFERDVQEVLDAWLAGEVDEKSFLAAARPWPNYETDYRPVVRLARRHGLEVLAANVPRPLAGRVAREGLEAVAGERHVPRKVHAGPGPYRGLFAQAMGGHGPGLEPEALDRYFAAQCLKDDAMAETIADYLAGLGERAPLVVHWCGGFHSDRRLGTVSRLARRRPYIDVAVVSTVRTDSVSRALTEEERELGDFVWLVRR